VSSFGQHDLVELLENLLGHSAHDELYWSDVLSDRVNWKDTAAVHFGFGIGEGWEDQSWAIHKADGSVSEVKVECLEMLGLTWHGCNSDTFLAAQDIDQRTLTDVWVSYCSNHKSVVDSLAQLHCSLLKQFHHLTSGVDLTGVESQVSFNWLGLSLGLSFFFVLLQDFLLEVGQHWLELLGLFLQFIFV
jgi:hypothetical protein